MARNANMIETITPSYEIIKWIGGGGFGQVFKVTRNGMVLACKQVQTANPHFALAEHNNMASVKEGPYIVTVHEDVEWNPMANTLSFFMDYYKGKDLERLIHVLRASGGRFTETQLLDIACQITLALEYCHSKSLLHQDMKPMNVLLRKPWNPRTEEIVPELSVTDFGISSRVRTLGTRLTAQRGTPGYEAPEIRGQGHRAEFSQKSDIYALGCVLYRLCTLSEPDDAAGIKPMDISTEYSRESLCLISSMLSLDRSDRPTATQVKLKILELIRRYFDPNSQECRKCKQLFPTKVALRQHLQETGHHQRIDHANTLQHTESSFREPELLIKGHQERVNKTGNSDLVQAFRRNGKVFVEPFQNTTCGLFDPKDERLASDMFDTGSEKDADHTPCAVCIKRFNSKKQFFKHLHCGHHWRRPTYVFRRFSELGIERPPKKRKTSFVSNEVDGPLSRRIKV